MRAALTDEIEAWLDELEFTGAALTTRTSYRVHLVAALADLERRLDRAPGLRDCTLRELRGCLLDYQRRPDRRRRESSEGSGVKLSPAPRSRRSLEARLQALRSFFSWCVREGLLERDPTAGLSLPAPSPPTPPSTLSREQADVLREAARSSRQPARDELLLALTLGSGLALGEVAALRLTDLDLTGGTLQVTSKLTRAGTSTRVLRCSPGTRTALEAYLPVRTALLARRGESSVFLLPAAEDLGTRTRSLGRHLQRLGTRAGLDCSSHTLRASFAHLALEKGASVREVQTTLGISLAALRRMVPPASGSVGVSVHPLG